jgi:hypothetical protein
VPTGIPSLVPDINKLRRFFKVLFERLQFALQLIFLDLRHLRHIRFTVRFCGVVNRMTNNCAEGLFMLCGHYRKLLSEAGVGRRKPLSITFLVGMYFPGRVLWSVLPARKNRAPLLPWGDSNCRPCRGSSFQER